MASPLAAASSEVSQGVASGAVPMSTGAPNSIPFNVAGIVIVSAGLLVLFDMMKFRFVVGANVG